MTKLSYPSLCFSIRLSEGSPAHRRCGIRAEPSILQVTTNLEPFFAEGHSDSEQAIDCLPPHAHTQLMSCGWHTWRIKQLRRRHLCGRLCCPKISPGIFYFLSSPAPFVCNKRWLLSVVLYIATGQSLEASLMLVIHALSGVGGKMNSNSIQCFHTSFRRFWKYAKLLL